MANIQIPITENGTTTLATAGKYCDRNIDVNVEVPPVQIPAYARYATLADALNDGTKSERGILGGYTDEDGLRHVVFLDDAQTSSILSVQKNCVIHLNGHALELTSETAQLEINTASHVVIDGTVAGSVLKKAVSSASSTYVKVVNVSNSLLTINGGEYAMTVADGSTSRAIVVAADATAKGIVMNDCVVTLDSYSTGFNKCVQSQAIVTIRDCTMSVTGRKCTTSTQVMCAHVRAAGTSLLENCTMSAKSYAPKHYVHTVFFDGGTGCLAVLNNCNMVADGFGDHDASMYGVACLGTSVGNEVTINGGHYTAAREAISPYGVIWVNGGIFEGCQHGGMYLGGETHVKNATIRNIPYFGDCGWSDQRFGACYCGYSAQSTKAYFDNCRFESDGRSYYGLVAKYNNTEVYLSNSTVGGDFSYDLRADAGNIIYLGENVDYDRIDPNSGTTIDTTTYAGQSFAW